MSASAVARRPAGARPTVRVIKGPQRERHEPDYVLLLTVLGLAALGLLMVYSTSGVGSLMSSGDPFAVVAPQAMWALLGLLAMFVMTRLDYRWLRPVSVIGFIVAVGLLIAVLLPPIPGVLRPIEGGGSTRWLQVGPLPAFHPAELTKLALVVFLAHWLDRRGARVGSLLNGLVPFLLLTAPLFALVLLEPDLGTTGVLVLTSLAMFVVAGGSLLQLLALAPAALALLAFLVSRSSYQMARVVGFLDPWADPQGIGFHTVQGLLALGMGGLFGIGLGESRQPGALHLPASQNDYVFAVVGQELGLIGGLAVIGAYLLLAYRGVKIALGAPDTFGALVAIGITAWLVMQAFINIAVVVVLVPVTGITLPFVSAGGSSLVVSFAAVGILLSISRESQQRGTWNNADPHRRRGNGRSHLPSAGRRAQPARAVR